MNTRTRIILGDSHPHIGPLISSYQDGATSVEETGMVERHLLECEVCRQFYQQLQQAKKAVGSLAVVPASSEELQAAFRKIRARTVDKAKQKKAGKSHIERINKQKASKQRSKHHDKFTSDATVSSPSDEETQFERHK